MRRGTALRTARWIVALALAAVCLGPVATAAHPMHSEAIERPCAVHKKGDRTSLIEGRCSFFLATGYLVFQLDPLPGGQGVAPPVVSGAINLSQATGSLFDAGSGPLADGAVAVADSSPQVVHMEPGELAAWDNGYVLEVSGSPAAAAGSLDPAVQRSSETLLQVFTNYLERGFVHIIPRGFDHMLFIVGLFLLSPRLKALLWQVSAFTVAHTVTLALGASGLLRLPAEIVEPLIALSIIWVAVENLLTDRLHRWRIVVVFCFGLLHGFGFAGVLLELGLSGAPFYAALLSFNLGVELGQLAVIALCFLAVGWAMKAPAYHGRVVVPSSCAIALIAAYWALERTLLA